MSRAKAIFAEIRRREVLPATAIYVVGGWIVLQAASLLFPGVGIPDFSIRYVLVGVLLGLPPAVYFAWRYDVSTHGISRTAAAGSGQQTDLPLDRGDFVRLAVLSLFYVGLSAAVTLQVVGTMQPADEKSVAPAAADNSIAVLPFASLSDNDSDDYFADGIADELLNQLANLGSLHVAARTSSFFFKGQNRPVQEIGRQLGVRNILEGSVRKAGNRLRITAQLIDVSNGYNLWSQTYDREAGDVFAVQEEIARAITSSLKVQVLDKESRRLARAPTDDFTAYDYYLLGQYQRELRNPESLRKSIELFRQAIDLDEQFALGYTGLALSYLYEGYYSGRAPEEVGQLAEPLLERALALDPGLAMAYGASGSVRLLLRDFEAADRNFLKAIDLQPNYAGAYSNLGFSKVLQSRLNEAETHYSKARALDPMNMNLTFNFGALDMLTGKFESGMDKLQEVKRLEPQRSNVVRALVHWSIVYGRYREALDWVSNEEEFPAGSENQLISLARIATGLGFWDRSVDLLNNVRADFPDSNSANNLLAETLFASGDHAALADFVALAIPRADSFDSTRFSPTNEVRFLLNGISAVIEGNYVQAESDLVSAAGGPDGIANAVYDEIRPLSYLAYTYRKMGRATAAEELLSRSLGLAREAHAQGWNTPTFHVRISQIYSMLGDTANAVESLESALRLGWLEAGILENDPLWDGLQDNVRFQAIIRRTNSQLAARQESICLGYPLLFGCL